MKKLIFLKGVSQTGKSNNNEENLESQQDQKEFNRLMDNYGNAMKEYHDEIDRNNTPILNAIKEERGQEFYDELCDYMKDSEVNGAFKIVNKPVGDKQYVGGPIEQEWVDQRSVGDSGDSWEGTVTVKISDGKYLEMPFSM